MGWLRLSMDLRSSETGSVETLLESFGALSITLSDAGDEPVLDPAPGASPLWRDCRLEALFDLDLDVGALERTLTENGLTAVAVDVLDDADWQNRWRQYAVDFCFGERLWLVPRDAQPGGEPALRLDPGLAFGSGSHPTTRLCLGWLAEQDLSAARVLDYGCGSGILGLAALKLGCARVLAIDHDPQALLATKENAAYNAIPVDDGNTLDACVDSAGCLQVAAPGRLDQGSFDVVLANILANPLIDLAPVLSGALAEGGVLVMSGMLEGQAADVAAAYPDLAFEPWRIEADDQDTRWACLVGRRGGAATTSITSG